MIIFGVTSNQKILFKFSAERKKEANFAPNRTTKNATQRNT